MRQRHRAYFFLLFSCVIQAAEASYCGVNGVPYSLEILSDGSPVLGCAQPTCMAEPLEDQEDSVFISNAAGQEDGFFREGDRQRKSYSQSYKPRADCPGTFSDLACTKKDQWVGGIDFIDHPRQPLILQCCSFEGLRFSQDVGVTTIAAGEAVTGGEVIREGRQISFDVIANVRRLVDPDDPKRTYYEVTVRRMNCLPDPPEFEVEYDDDVPAEISRVLGNATNSAMEFGHTGHPHMTQEKKLSKRPYKRKPKTSSTHNVISPLAGHEESEKRGRSEPFIGSFGATIFNPTEDAEKKETVPPPTRHSAPFTRRIITPKPRVTTTVAPTTVPPVHVQVDPQPVAASTPLPNPFEFRPLPPFPNFGLIQPNLFAPPFAPAAPPAPPPPPPQQLFGVPQAPHVPLPPPQHPHFGLFAPQPPAPQFGTVQAYGLNPQPAPTPAYGLQQDQLNDLDSYTRSLLTNPNSPFALQMPMFAAPPSPQYGYPQQNQVDQYSVQNLQRINIQAPQRDNIVPSNNNNYIPSPPQHVAPQNNQLGQIYRPPPFAALGTTLYNFQSHSG